MKAKTTRENHDLQYRADWGKSRWQMRSSRTGERWNLTQWKCTNTKEDLCVYFRYFHLLWLYVAYWKRKPLFFNANVLISACWYLLSSPCRGLFTVFSFARFHPNDSLETSDWKRNDDVKLVGFTLSVYIVRPRNSYKNRVNNFNSLIELKKFKTANRSVKTDKILS